MVELAFVLILLVTLLVGVVSAAVAFGRDNSIQNAAREASRFGATLTVETVVDDWLDEVRDVARAAAAGNLDPSVPGVLICVALVDGSADRRLVDTGTATAYADNDCYSEYVDPAGDGRPAGEKRVQVFVARDIDFEAIVFSTDITISADAAARYER